MRIPVLQVLLTFGYFQIHSKSGEYQMAFSVCDTPIHYTFYIINSGRVGIYIAVLIPLKVFDNSNMRLN